MDKNILKKLLAEYDQDIDGILKKYGEKDGLDEIAGLPMFLSGTDSLGRTLSKNPVISADSLDSRHSFIRGIRDKISTKRSRIATNDANYTNLVAIKSECFLEFSIVLLGSGLKQ